MAYTFVQLDPRPNAQNPVYNFGVEVTMRMPQGIPNLDHHGSADTADTLSACEQALTCELPADGFVIATVRPDQDSVTAMAVLASRLEGRMVDEDVVGAIGLFDRYGPRSEERLSHREVVIAVARRTADFRIPLGERVSFVQSCLDGTVDMEEVARLVEERNAEFVAAEAASTVVEVIPGKLVYVESTHRFATNLGYKHASTVVAYNPQMAVMENIGGKMQPTGATYRKFTVCRYDSNVTSDLPAALAELQSMDSDWGGRGDIFGSPQNRDANQHPMTVIALVARHIQ